MIDSNNSIGYDNLNNTPMNDEPVELNSMECLLL